MMWQLITALTRDVLEESFTKIIPLNEAETVTLNLHENKRQLYLVRYFTEAEKIRRGSNVNMVVFVMSIEAADTLLACRRDVLSKLGMMSVGLDIDERIQLDSKHNYLGLDASSNCCHFRNYYLNESTGERLPGKKGCSVSPTDVIEMYECLPELVDELREE